MSAHFNVLHAELVLEGETYAGGEQKIEKPSKGVLRLLNHLHAAGAVELEGADPAAHGVQSQEEGEAAYAAAQADGSWQASNAEQSALDAEAKETYVDVGEEL